MMKLVRSVAVVASLGWSCSTVAWASKIDPALLVPEVKVLIDTSRVKFNGEIQFDFPRDNRGIAVSPTGRYLYLGYNNSLSGGGEVRRFDLQNGEIDAFDTRVTGLAGKSIAVDDKGRVYIAADTSVIVYNPSLSGVPLLTIPMDALVDNEGVAVRRNESGVLSLYTSNRTAGGGVTKWIIDEDEGDDFDLVGADKDDSYGLLGTAAIPSSVSLRGLDVDDEGNVWVADFGNAADSRLFRIPDGGGVATSRSFGPNGQIIDVAVNDDAAGDQVLITGYVNRNIRMFDASAFTGLDPLNFGDGDVGNGFLFDIPFLSLELEPTGQGFIGAVAGIALAPNDRGFYVTNEHGQTLDEKSTYGVTDGNSGFNPIDPTDPRFYQDATRDDNEPVIGFLIPIPEPAALALGSIALLGFLVYAYRQRRQTAAI